MWKKLRDLCSCSRHRVDHGGHTQVSTYSDTDTIMQQDMKSVRFKLRCSQTFETANAEYFTANDTKGFGSVNKYYQAGPITETQNAVYAQLGIHEIQHN